MSLDRSHPVAQSGSTLSVSYCSDKFFEKLCLRAHLTAELASRRACRLFVSATGADAARVHRAARTRPCTSRARLNCKVIFLINTLLTLNCVDKLFIRCALQKSAARASAQRRHRGALCCRVAAGRCASGATNGDSRHRELPTAAPISH